MRLMLCTLCLNEMEWLPRLYRQHKDWPGVVSWVFVEAADVAYARANPSMVSTLGLSVDGTSDFLRNLSRDDPHVTYIPHGLTAASDPAQSKVQARQRYLSIAEQVEPDAFIILDADEFYTEESQRCIPRWLRDDFDSVSLKFRHPWRPPALADGPLFQYEVVGGFWDMAHCHVFRWKKGLRYGANHNTPEGLGGILLNARMFSAYRMVGAPECVHMAFASSRSSREAKHAYYRERGEGRTDKRGWYVASRRAWEMWTPGATLPRGARVIPWSGAVPEVFSCESEL